MILDALLLFTGGSGAGTPGNGDGRTDSPTTGTQASSNVVDLAGPAIPASSSALGGQPGRDLGIGDDPALKILVQVITAFGGGTSLQVAIAGAPDNGAGAPGSYTPMAYGQVVTEANLIVGARLLQIDMPRTGPLAIAPPRFLELQYVNSGTHTSGAIFGTIVLDRDDQIENTNAVLGGYTPGVVVAN